MIVLGRGWLLVCMSLGFFLNLKWMNGCAVDRHHLYLSLFLSLTMSMESLKLDDFIHWDDLMVWDVVCGKAHCRKGCYSRCWWSLSLSLSSSTAHHLQCDATAIVTVATAVAASWWCSVWRMHSNHLQDMQHSISLSRVVRLHISVEENQLSVGVLSSSLTRTLFSDYALMKRINLQLAVVMLCRRHYHPQSFAMH